MKNTQFEIENMAHLLEKGRIVSFYLAPDNCLEDGRYVCEIEHGDDIKILQDGMIKRLIKRLLKFDLEIEAAQKKKRIRKRKNNV